MARGAQREGPDRPSSRPLLDKLSVKAGARISLLGFDDPAFLQQLEERAADISSRPRKDSDLIFFFMEDRADLPRLRALRHNIHPAGAIWVLWRKGRKELREEHIRAFGPDVGLVDVKVVSFSDTLSALKMVIPLALR